MRTPKSRVTLLIDLPAHVKRFVHTALREDIGRGDVTTRLTIPKSHRSTAVLIAKSDFILAGLPIAEEAFRALDDRVIFEPASKEGMLVTRSMVFARVTGPTRAILSSERVALNILQRLSGIATLTNAFIRQTKGLKAKILDTRKTTPGMRWLEKYAVRTGGGHNHRFGLYDGVLIKDNHILAVGGISKAVELARMNKKGLKVEVEAENLKEVKEALEAGADIIMLDNMQVVDIRKAVSMAGGKAELEVSGNVTLENVRLIAETGVNLISVGALTHSAPAADISMKLLQDDQA